MPDVTPTMRRAAARIDELLEAGRVPLDLRHAMRALQIRGNQHVARCPSCAAALERSAPGVPARGDLCGDLADTWQALGSLAALIVDPDTAELGPLARRIES